MAEKIAAVEDFLTCSICLETFKEPVSLGCNHSFCSSCLHKYWDKNDTKNCPVCRRKSSKDSPDVNFALKKLSVSFSKKDPSEAGEEKIVCGKHPQVPPMICWDESQVFCPVCKLSLHRGHRVEAVSELKEQLKSNLKSLKKKRGRISVVQQTFEEMVRHSEKQVEQSEAQIRAVFSQLHQFLKKEEQSALTALREEQHRQVHTIGPELENLREQLSSLDLSITTVENQLQKDTMDFIRDYRQTQSAAQTLITQPNPKLVPGLLINQSKVLGNVGFKVWEKMRSTVHCSPVILDPNTANDSLYLSEDLTSVRNGDAEQELPNNPERFTYTAEVLGSEGFTSGRHQWVVEVGDHPDWNIGVVKVWTADPENGFWTLNHSGGKYTHVDGNNLKLRWRPQKIQVHLDYNQGEVSFYNENMRFICSHRDTFTEKLFPYFYVGEAGEAKTKVIQICSSEVQ